MRIEITEKFFTICWRNQVTIDLHAKIYNFLFNLYGECICPLEHNTPFHLLVAVRLSAQCRDERVNIVTRQLFEIAGTPQKMAEFLPEDIQKIIRPCGLFNQKSIDLVAMSKLIVEKFNGEIPANMEDLLLLPGIGRKSANVILGNAFGIPGFPVDTHVKRLLYRLGATDSSVPEVIEREVCTLLPAAKWTNYSHLLIQHGRQCCFARNQNCMKCTLSEFCPRRKK